MAAPTACEAAASFAVGVPASAGPGPTRPAEAGTPTKNRAPSGILPNAPPGLAGTSLRSDEILESLISVNSRSPCKGFDVMTLHNEESHDFRVGDLVAGTIQHNDGAAAEVFLGT